MPNYDATRYAPPAPVAFVTIRNPQTVFTVSEVTLLIDSGADITLLPRSAVDQLGLSIQSTDKVELVGFDGNRSYAQVVTLDLMFLNRTYRGQFLLCDDAHGILGRDLLNHVKLVLDGPLCEWSQLVS